jgi:mannose/fructose/N-acetylgalactosamine-specific phosphotransferase system component IIB
MTIVLARVDNRLLHGQILAAWVPTLDADSILILDDEAFGNILARSAMELAVPPDVQFEVSPVSQATAALDRLKGAQRTVVLLRDVADASRALDAGLSLTRLNIGNVHFATGRAAVSQAVHLSPSEIAVLQAIEGRGVTVELKTLPRDTPVPLAELKHRVEAGSAA